MMRRLLVQRKCRVYQRAMLCTSTQLLPPVLRKPQVARRMQCERGCL